MRGAPRDGEDGANLRSNFEEIWDNAQTIDHDVESAKPSDTEGRDGEIRLGLVGGVYKLYAKIGGAWKEATLT